MNQNIKLKFKILGLFLLAILVTTLFLNFICIFSSLIIFPIVEKSKYINDVFVSTDSQEIADISFNFLLYFLWFIVLT